VVVILNFTGRDLKTYYFKQCLLWCTAHCSWGYKTYSHQHCLWFWYCTLQRGINNLFHSTLSVELILHITAGDLQLIPFNTFCGDDTAY
jgi:hypothetical protein